VVCLITRHRHGVILRKLAPLFPVTVNGKAVVASLLAHGDRLTVGPLEVLVHIGNIEAAEEGGPAPQAEAAPEVGERVRELDERQRRLEEQARALENERVLWYRRRDELEQECRRLHEGPVPTGEAWADLDRRRQELDVRAAQLAQQQEQTAEVRREL